MLGIKSGRPPVGSVLPPSFFWLCPLLLAPPSLPGVTTSLLSPTSLYGSPTSLPQDLGSCRAPPWSGQDTIFRLLTDDDNPSQSPSHVPGCSRHFTYVHHLTPKQPWDAGALLSQFIDEKTEVQRAEVTGSPVLKRSPQSPSPGHSVKC